MLIKDTFVIIVALPIDQMQSNFGKKETLLVSMHVLSINPQSTNNKIGCKTKGKIAFVWKFDKNNKRTYELHTKGLCLALIDLGLIWDWFETLPFRRSARNLSKVTTTRHHPPNFTVEGTPPSRLYFYKANSLNACYSKRDQPNLLLLSKRSVLIGVQMFSNNWQTLQ